MKVKRKTKKNKSREIVKNIVIYTTDPPQEYSFGKKIVENKEKNLVN